MQRHPGNSHRIHLKDSILEKRLTNLQKQLKEWKLLFWYHCC